MNLTPQLTTLLRVELDRLNAEIDELNKQAEPIRSLLNLSNPAPPPGIYSEGEPEAPPFPYRTEPLAPATKVPKVRFSREFELFCKPRVGQVISVKSFKAYLSANFPEGSYVEHNASTAVHTAYKAGKLELVSQGTRGNTNPTTYRIKEVAA